MKIYIVVLFISSLAFGFKEYYSFSKSTRSLGMGGAFYGLSNDEYALFYNPAGLNFYEGGAEGMFSFNFEVSPAMLSAINILLEQFKSQSANLTTLVDKLESFQGNILHTGVGVFPYYLRKHFAIGLLLADLKTNFAILGKDMNTTFDAAAILDSGLFIGFGHKLFRDDLFWGLTIKGLLRGGGRKEFELVEIAQSQSFNVDIIKLGGVGVGADFDLALTYQLPINFYKTSTKVSLVLNNVLASKLDFIKNENFGTPPALSRMLSIGTVTTLPGIYWFDNFLFLLDLAEFSVGGESRAEFGARTGSFFKHVNFGVEAPINGWLFLRTGFHQGYLTAGLGLYSRFVKLDLATYEEELFSNPGQLGSRRYAMRLVFGVGGAKPAVAPKVKEKAPEKPKVVEPEAKEKPSSKDQKSMEGSSKDQSSLEGASKDQSSLEGSSKSQSSIIEDASKDQNSLIKQPSSQKSNKSPQESKGGKKNKENNFE